jgi:dipeptidyl-peptidase-4
MTKKHIWIYLLAASINLTAIAQQKKLTIEDAVLKQRTTLAPERLSQLSTIPGTDNIWWVNKPEGGRERILVHYTDENRYDTVLTVETLDMMVQNAGVQVPKFERFPFIKFINMHTIRFSYAGIYYQYDIKAEKIEVLNRLVAMAESPEASPNGDRVAFVLNNNVMLFDKDGYDNYQKMISGDGATEVRKDKKDYIQEIFITRDGSPMMEYGKSVHRNEFGINKGLFWSPNGKILAYYRQLQSMVTDYPLLKTNKTPASVEPIKYPMAGAMSHHVTLFVYNTEKKISLPVQIKGDPEQYITNISFSADDNFIYAAIVNRDQNEMAFNKYDATTGAFVRTMFTETHPKYVEPENAAVFLKQKKGYFLWMSKRDGYNHVYLYDHQGQVILQVTKGNYDVKDILSIDEKSNKLYYTVAVNNGLDRHVYVSEMTTGKTTPLLFAQGTNTAIITANNKYIVNSYSSVNVPRRVTLNTIDGKEMRVLLNATNPLTEYQRCDIRLFTIKSADKSTDLNCRMILPHKADTLKKKYPVLVYVYGGPHSQMITNSYLGGADLWLYYMAQEGYIVFTIDNRGTANRGLAFEQATFRQLGKVETEDQMEGVKYLKTLKYVDGEKMGVFGWSFGGFMTLNLMTRENVFKAGVAGGPVVDWNWYEIMYTERYMDKPADNPDGYAAADMTKYIKNLKGKLMLIHGTEDDVVVWQHSLNYLKKSVDEGVQIDYFVYPGHKHNVIGKDRVHLMQKVTDYMNLYVK